MPDIFDEVEEDLRAERMRRMLRRYGGLLVAAAVVVVVGVAGYEAWVWHQSRGALSVAETYLAATKAADAPPGADRAAADPLLAEVVAKGGAGYRALARLRQAALLAEAGDVKAANAVWDRVAADGPDPLLRDFADLQWILHNVDAGDPAALTARLARLTAPGNPWHGLADEAQALLQLRQGQIDAARDTLRLLAQDTGAPQGVRQRASGLLEQIGPVKATGS